MTAAQHTLISISMALALSATACGTTTPSESTSFDTKPASAGGMASGTTDRNERQFTRNFRLEACTFQSVGHNPYFPLIPGRVTIFQGEQDGKALRLEQTILNETINIGGIDTRILQERHTEDGELVEISRNYFAQCVETGSVFYFGEDTDNYENGKIVNHKGTWRHGVNGARAGLVMPGIVLLGSRYFQELAPPVALDQAEITQLGGTVTVPFGQFSDVLVTAETTPLEPGVVEFKTYTPGIGQIVDDVLRLVDVRDVP